MIAKYRIVIEDIITLMSFSEEFNHLALLSFSLDGSFICRMLFST